MLAFGDDDDELDAEERAALEAALAKRKAQQPASLEERLEEQKRANEMRPVFVSKAQREETQAEIEAEQAEIEELMQEAEREQRQNYMQKVREEMREKREKAHQRPEVAKEKEKEAPKVPMSKEDVDKEKELQAIKDSYLGVKKKKKKVLKISEKFRFSFDWNNEEDTSTDLNPLYEKKHEALLLFGRGLRAGIDRREQLSKRDTTLQGRYDDAMSRPQMPPQPPVNSQFVAQANGGSTSRLPYTGPPPGYSMAPPPPPPGGPSGMVPPPPPGFYDGCRRRAAASTATATAK